MIFGSGATLLWQKNLFEGVRSEHEQVSKALVIRKNIDRAWETITQLSDEYIEAYSSFCQDSSSNAANEMDMLRSRLRIEKMNFASQEALLSSIEGRSSRQIELDFATIPNIKPAQAWKCSVSKPEKQVDSASGH